MCSPYGHATLVSTAHFALYEFVNNILQQVCTLMAISGLCAKPGDDQFSGCVAACLQLSDMLQHVVSDAKALMQCAHVLATVSDNNAVSHLVYMFLDVIKLIRNEEQSTTVKPVKVPCRSL